MKHETEPKQACLISVACRSVKYQLNEVKIKLQIYLKKDQRFWVWIVIDFHFVHIALRQTTGYNDCASTSLFGFVLDRKQGLNVGKLDAYIKV